MKIFFKSIIMLLLASNLYALTITDTISKKRPEVYDEYLKQLEKRKELGYSIFYYDKQPDFISASVVTDRKLFINVNAYLEWNGDSTFIKIDADQEADEVAQVLRSIIDDVKAVLTHIPIAVVVSGNNNAISENAFATMNVQAMSAQPVESKEEAQKKLYDRYYKQGYLYYAEGSYAKALKSYEKSLIFDEDSVDSLFWITKSLLKLVSMEKDKPMMQEYMIQLDMYFGMIKEESLSDSDKKTYKYLANQIRIVKRRLKR